VFKRRIGIVLVVMAALALPALALGVASGRPAAGSWTISGGGGFTVNASQTAISNYHFRSICGFHKVIVLGSQPLHVSTVAGVTNWMVGYPDPSRKNRNDVSGVVPQRVKFRTGGKTLSGRIDLIFGVGGNPKNNSGLVEMPGGCDGEYAATK
jgi:hypothetical protein